MPWFDYSGQLASGAGFDGTIEATDLAAAEQLLSELGVRITSLRPARRSAYVPPLTLEEFTFFNEQLTALTKASLPLDEGLRQLAADSGSRRLKRVLQDLAADLTAGTPLEDALQRQRARFPAGYARVVAAGLQSGDLGGTLYGLSTHLRLRSHLRRTLIELATYPVAVLVLCFVLASFVVQRVVPELILMVQQTVYDYGVSWPRLSWEVAAAMQFLAAHWVQISIALGAVLVLLTLTPAVLRLLGAVRVQEALLRRVPGLGQVYWSSVLARFAHTSALAAYAGTPLPELLVASSAAAGSPALAGAARRAGGRLATGEAVGPVLAAERDIPALWACAVAIAGPRGDLAAALTELARTYEQRAQQWVATVRAILTPALFVFLAIVISGLLLPVLVLINANLHMMQALT